MSHLVDDAPDGHSTNGGVDWDDRRQYYERWFGSLDASRVSAVRRKIGAIRLAFADETILVRCTIALQPKAECMADNKTIAWVNAEEIKKSINLCEPFWNKPRSGINSQGGALLHELSHFTAIAVTDDDKDGKDPRSCETLAFGDPGRAVKNAYNYQYFAEDMPSYGPSFGCTGCTMGRRPDATAPLGAVLALCVGLGWRSRRARRRCATDGVPRRDARRHP